MDEPVDSKYVTDFACVGLHQCKITKGQRKCLLLVLYRHYSMGDLPLPYLICGVVANALNLDCYTCSGNNI